jgi:hypothetical protein
MRNRALLSRLEGVRLVFVLLVMTLPLLAGCTCSKKTAPASAGVAGLDSATLAGPTPLLSRGHAHNDYEHPRPLLDALDHGFCSVEADVVLAGGELRVAHHRVFARSGCTLQRLYLDPLRRRVKANGGRVYTGGPGFTLLIDIKSDGPATYAALRPVLDRYAEMLTVFRKGGVEEKAVTVILSGDSPRVILEGQAERRVALDGRPSDLKSSASEQLIPLVSDRWSSQFSWDGDGPMPQEERRKLRRMVETAHSQGRRVRFWATPEVPGLWAELVAANVDHIGTDELGQLRTYLTTQR